MQCDNVPVSTPLNKIDIEPMQVDARKVVVTGSQGINLAQTLIDDSLTASGSADAYRDEEYSDEEDLSKDEEFVSK